MKNLRPKNLRPSVLLATCALLAVMPSVADASIITAGEDVPASAVSGGVGNIVQPILSLSVPGNTTTQTGSSFVGAGGVPNQSSGNVDTGGNPARTQTPTLSTLGWNTGSVVAIGFAPNQTGSTLGITIESLMLTLYNGNTGGILGRFSTATPIDFSLIGNPGTANNWWALALSGAEQQQFDTAVADSGLPLTQIRAGLTSTMTGANAGSDRLYGFDINSVQIVGPPNPDLMPPTPEIPLPAGLPLFASGVAGLGLLGWRRKRKSTTSALAA